MWELIAFYRKIRAEPKNTLTWGILADYLEEKGIPTFFCRYLQDTYFTNKTHKTVTLIKPRSRQIARVNSFVMTNRPSYIPPQGIIDYSTGEKENFSSNIEWKDGTSLEQVIMDMYIRHFSGLLNNY